VATDGEAGKVRDAYFDDDEWTVKYLVVDTGTWLDGRHVLISPRSVRGVDWDRQQLDVSLTKTEVEGSPSTDSHKPVSRQMEERVVERFGSPVYWMGPFAWGSGTPVSTILKPSMTEFSRPSRADRHLRSAKAISGYHTKGTDGEIGHLNDFAFDEQSWEIKSLVIDTSNFWFGRLVAIDVAWIRDIRWDEEKMYINLPAEVIREASPYDPNSPISRGYEHHLHFGHGGRRH